MENLALAATARTAIRKPRELPYGPPTAAHAIGQWMQPPMKRHKVRKDERSVQWAIGIVTAPRRDGTEYLSICLRSCIDAGFDPEDIHIFAEPGSPIPEWAEPAGVSVTRRGKRLGVFPNHYSGLMELAFGQATQTADAYFIMECDVKLCPGLRFWLEQKALWPDEPADIGAVSVYTPSLYGNSTPGWMRWNDEGFWGAQTLIIPRESLLAYLTTNHAAAQHREKSNAATASNFADGEISTWAARTGRYIYFPIGWDGTSLAEHIGHDSAVFPTLTNNGWRKEWWSVRAAMRGEKSPGACPYDSSKWSPKRRAKRPVVVPEATLAAVRNRRLPICQDCKYWFLSAVDGKRRCKRCTSCSPITEETLHNINLKCPAGVAGW